MKIRPSGYRMRKNFTTLHDGVKSTIILNDKTKVVHKILKKPNPKLNQFWFETYQKYQEGKPIVKIFELINDSEYTMEYVPYVNDLEQIVKDSNYRKYLTKDFICDALAIFNSSFVDAIKFSKQYTHNDQRYFMHYDLKLSNFLVDKNKKITLIDPDSFIWMRNLESCEKFYMNQINLMFSLQRYFNSPEGMR